MLLLRRMQALTARKIRQTGRTVIRARLIIEREAPALTVRDSTTKMQAARNVRIAATVLIARVSIRTPRTGASVRNARIAATALIARASTRMPKTGASARNAFIVRNNVLTATSNALMATNNALTAAMSSVLIVRAIIMRTLTVRNALTTPTVRPMAMPTVRCVRVIIT